MAPTSTPLVSRVQALKQMTHHQFLPGVGYLQHSGPPDLPEAAKGTKNCSPPANTPNGSFHLLKPPTGAPPLTLIWVASEKAWASQHPGKGHRLAFSTNHLMRAGWEYVGLAPEQPPRPAPKPRG